MSREKEREIGVHFVRSKTWSAITLKREIDSGVVLG
jgi:hypothetical protein